MACGCREPRPSSSGDEPVLVAQSAEDGGSPNVFRVGIGDRDHRFGERQGQPLIERSVKPMPVVVVHVLGDDGFEMAASEDEEPVQALSADGADEPLGSASERSGLDATRRRLDRVLGAEAGQGLDRGEHWRLQTDQAHQVLVARDDAVSRRGPGQRDQVVVGGVAADRRGFGIIHKWSLCQHPVQQDQRYGVQAGDDTFPTKHVIEFANEKRGDHQGQLTGPSRFNELGGSPRPAQRGGDKHARVDDRPHTRRARRRGA